MSTPDPLDRDILEAMTQYELTGDGVWLLEAVRRCGQYRKPMPRFVREAFDAALRRYHEAEARSLDEAFSIKRAKGWNQGAELNRKRYGWAIYCAVEKLHEAGRPLDEELFAEVAQDFPLSGATVRNIYREVKAVLREQAEQLAAQ